MAIQTSHPGHWYPVWHPLPSPGGQLERAGDARVEQCVFPFTYGMQALWIVSSRRQFSHMHTSPCSEGAFLALPIGINLTKSPSTTVEAIELVKSPTKVCAVACTPPRTPSSGHRSQWSAANDR